MILPVIGEYGDKVKEATMQPIHVFDLEKKEYFPYLASSWSKLKTTLYTIDIDGHTIHIPRDYHILIGDLDGGIDVIKPDELIGREFDALVFHKHFVPDFWQLLPMRVVDIQEGTIELPNVKKSPFPVVLSDKTALLVSESDIYSDIRTFSFSDFTSETC